MRWLLAAHEKEIPGFENFSAGDWRPHAVGVGQFASLAELSRLLAHARPAAILLAGTAGAIESTYVGQIFVVQHFAYPSIPGEELPDFLERAFTTQAAVALGGVPPATVLQNHGVTTDAGKFASNTGYIPPGYPKPIIENMEAASLAQLCRRMQIPFTALIAVTNTIGPDARSQWKQNFRQAGVQIAQTLQQIVR